jgi:hypothetical protein
MVVFWVVFLRSVGTNVTSPHGVTTLKINIDILTAVITSSLIN